jgi:hypothetical protein
VRRIAAVLDGPLVPAWQRRALALIADSSRLELVELRFTAPPRRGRVARLHAAAERHLFALGPDALAPGPLAEPTVAGAGDGAELVVWLSETPPPAGEHRQLLHLRHGRREEPAEAAFRRAVLRGEPCVESEALLRTGTGTRILQRTVSGARPYSTTLSRDKALWKIAAMVVRAAERAPGLDLPAGESADARRAPSTAELVLRSPWRWLRVLTARLRFARPWRTWVRERAPDPAAGWQSAPALVRWRRGHLYADPFLFEHGGRHHLFCEDLAPGSQRAVVSHVELDAGARAPEPVLETAYHLSYPFVFEHEGEVFMIPETSSQQRVELYRAVDFPRGWRREAILLEDVSASDATVLSHDGRLWMFVSIAEPHATMLDELHVFSAEELRGPWRAHPANPVVSDVRCGRPAGAIQRLDERLVRPAQDGSERYGGAVSMREIDELSLTSYREHEVARIEPRDLGAAVRATHTYACDSRFEAVDLRERERARPQAILAAARAKLLARGRR